MDGHTWTFCSFCCVCPRCVNHSSNMSDFKAAFRAAKEQRGSSGPVSKKQGCSLNPEASLADPESIDDCNSPVISPLLSQTAAQIRLLKAQKAQQKQTAPEPAVRGLGFCMGGGRGGAPCARRLTLLLCLAHAGSPQGLAGNCKPANATACQRQQARGSPR